VTVYCATTNSGKIAEFRLAASGSVVIEPLPLIGEIPACAETGTTFEENAIQKALYYGSHTSGWLFAEDSGLEVDALGGEPGVYSARYAGPDATDDTNNVLVLERLGSSVQRSARFVCAIALVHAGALVKTFRGTVEGEILSRPNGSNGFGYDPIFFYPPFGCSFGEISRERKQTVSHRGTALNLVVEYLKRNTPHSV
jgi:XTP/dITP diphosphohydrolase